MDALLVGGDRDHEAVEEAGQAQQPEGRRPGLANQTGAVHSYVSWPSLIRRFTSPCARSPRRRPRQASVVGRLPGRGHTAPPRGLRIGRRWHRLVRPSTASTGALSERTNGPPDAGASVVPSCPCQAVGALVAALPVWHRHRRRGAVRPLRETVRPLRETSRPLPEMGVQPRPGCRRRLLRARPPQAPPVQARLSATGWPEPPSHPETPRSAGVRSEACAAHRQPRRHPTRLAGAVVVPGTTSGAYETPPLQP